MDGTTRFYDIRLGQFTCDDLGEPIQAMCMANSGRAYAVSSLNNSIYLVDRSSGNKVMEYSGHQVNGFSIKCRFNEDDTHMYTGSADGKLYVYEIMKKEAVRVVEAGSSPLSGLDIHPNSGLVGAAHNGSVYYLKL